MLPTLNEISFLQSAPTQDTITKCNKVLNYSSIHPKTTIQYHANNSILMTYTDAAYFVLPTSISRVAGNYYFTNRMLDYYKVTSTPNGPILIEFNTLKTVGSSSAEAETGGTFEKAQNAIPLRHIIKTVFLHHKPTIGSPTGIDNITYEVILTSII